MSTDFTAALQRYADEDHARQPTCSWCGRPGEPYEHNGVRYDGLTSCQGDRLCKGCTDRYLEGTPLLVEDRWHPDFPGRVYDLNRNTAAWSEENIPGCHGEPPVQCIAAEYRYADYRRPSRRKP